jgi:bifunctional enzyme CysN/CysC
MSLNASAVHDLAPQDEIAPILERALFRFITCGSVDDGKSTLIGRLLFETGALFEDQMSHLARDSLRFGTQGQTLDYALLLDGLEAEREQGITIDVAYRFFHTSKRKFIAADCPGHVQYTRNMATGASSADAAIVLVDARKGLSPQTLRHSQILSLLGVPRVILAVNKMDACNYDQQHFEGIVAAYSKATAGFGFIAVHAIPVSALAGDNLLQRSTQTPWYRGASVLELLETLPNRDAAQASNQHFQMPVQWVCRPNQDFRGFAGRIARGQLHVGQTISVAAAGPQQPRVKNILRGDKSVECAISGDSIVVELDRELDISRGDVLTSVEAPAQRTEQFEAKILWTAEQPLVMGKRYWLKSGNSSVLAEVTRIAEQLSFADQTHTSDGVQMNQLARVSIRTLVPIVLENYQDSRELGAFILIDRVDHAVAAAGVVLQVHAAHQTVLDIDQDQTCHTSANARAYWFTGISGAGKTTIAKAFEAALKQRGNAVIVLDGDALRAGVNADLDLSRAGRAEHLRRTAEIAKLMLDAGLTVIVSLISPYAIDRAIARSIIGDARFLEVHIDTPLNIARLRDPKGLYAKAASGSLQGMTGIDAPYEAPTSPDIRLETNQHTVDEFVRQLLSTI